MLLLLHCGRWRSILLRMSRRTKLLIVGAGPFGLAMAACAADRSIDHAIIGQPMHSWRCNMPQGMLLRSRCDWHLDPGEDATIARYLQSLQLDEHSVEPLSRDFYLSYVDWFVDRKGIEPIQDLVTRLDTDNGAFAATLASGAMIKADNVLLALGFSHFPHVPGELAALLPPGRYAHTCDLVSFEHLAGKRCLIVGGRQSAFEWSALLSEQGADMVHVSHRHDTPEFADSEWELINQMMARFVDEPGWYRSLSGADKSAVQSRFAQARLRLEPWLWPRINKKNVKLWPNTRLVSCAQRGGPALRVGLDNGETLLVDYVILATGYRVNMQRVDFLAAGNVLPALELSDGYPELDDQLGSSIPGLFITSLPATQHFGPFFGFTIAVKASAELVARALR